MSDFVISEPVDPRDLPAVTPEEEAEFVAAQGDGSPVEDDAEEQPDVDPDVDPDAEPEVNDDPRDLGDLVELIDGVDVEDVDIEGVED